MWGQPTLYYEWNRSYDCFCVKFHAFFDKMSKSAKKHAMNADSHNFRLEHRIYFKLGKE